MSTQDPDSGMAEAFEANVEKLGRGENPLAQGGEDSADTASEETGTDTAGTDDDPDGHADVFSPHRTDEPD